MRFRLYFQGKKSPSAGHYHNTYIIPVSVVFMKLKDNFFQKKAMSIQESIAEQDIHALVLFDPSNIAYVTGFFHLQTERPLAAVIPQEGDPLLLIPLLEKDHVPSHVNIETYFDYPGEINRIKWIKSHLKSLNFTKIGIESNIPLFTYDILNTLTVIRMDLLSAMRLIKEPEEIALISKAAEYADFAVKRAVHHCEEGISEFEINEKTRMDVSERMLQELEEIVPVQGGLCGGLVCSGENGALPHAMPSSKKVKKGEAIILSFGATVGGYHAESERTAFLGTPTARHRKAFETMASAQDRGGAALREGARCCDVNESCLEVIQGGEFELYLRHRMGHGIGLQGHEPPWLDEGDTTTLKTGMTVSNEPGIYIPGFAGFRHSDTLVVTRSGSRSLTTYPKDLDSLIIS